MVAHTLTILTLVLYLCKTIPRMNVSTTLLLNRWWRCRSMASGIPHRVSQELVVQCWPGVRATFWQSSRTKHL